MLRQPVKHTNRSLRGASGEHADTIQFTVSLIQIGTQQGFVKNYEWLIPEMGKCDDEIRSLLIPHQMKFYGNAGNSVGAIGS
jgi:hypothetical protein